MIRIRHRFKSMLWHFELICRCTFLWLYQPRVSPLTLCTLVVVSCLSALTPAPVAGCEPLGYDRATLLQLRSENFVIEDPEQRNRFALALLNCLGDPDPVLRDQIAYEAFSTMLRGKQLQTETIKQLRSSLIEQLATQDHDEDNFRQSFAALVLSEVARTDRIDPIFSDEERAEIVRTASSYMRAIDDYRGFSETDGWRHSVAHTADLLMQLALNPALNRAQLIEIRDAVTSQIVPTDAHFYIYGESRRLARPILFVALRGVLTEQDWTPWFNLIASSEPFGKWGEVYSTQAGLAKLHNTRAFAQAIYVSATANERAELIPLRSGALTVLNELP